MSKRSFLRRAEGIEEKETETILLNAVQAIGNESASDPGPTGCDAIADSNRNMSEIPSTMATDMLLQWPLDKLDDFTKGVGIISLLDNKECLYIY